MSRYDITLTTKTHGCEIIDGDDDRATADYLLGEYRVAFNDQRGATVRMQLGEPDNDNEEEPTT